MNQCKVTIQLGDETFTQTKQIYLNDRPVSTLYFCKKCGEIWARTTVEIKDTDIKDLYMVRNPSLVKDCKDHVKDSSLLIDYLYASEGYWIPWILEWLPEKLLKRELELAILDAESEEA